MKFSNSEFVPLHVHTTFSCFDGLAQLDDLVMTAREMGFPALAITDHGNIGGWIKFIEHCEATKDKKGNPINHPPITPILGCEFYLSADHTHSSNKEQMDGKQGNRHLTIFAKNFKGYQNLCTLSQLSFTDGFFHNPRIDINQLAEHHEGLIVGSACLSSVINANLLCERYKEAKSACALFKDIFKDDFFLEVMYHGIPEEQLIIPDIFKLSSEMDIPIVATNDSHYIKKEQASSQEVLMCMSMSKCIHDPKRYKFPYGEFYLKSAAEMAIVWGDNPEVMHNSLAIMERINHKDIKDNLFGGMRLPAFEVPDGFKDAFDYLKHLAKEGMKKKGWDQSKQHIERLKLELSDVKAALDHNDYDFATYFLIVWDYINYAREKGILVGYGRGSGYASVLLHCLGICSGIDPLSQKLLWERFLGFSNSKFVLPKDFGFKDVQKSVENTSDYSKTEKSEDGSGISRY